jgi:hypothetical protein
LTVCEIGLCSATRLGILQAEALTTARSARRRVSLGQPARDPESFLELGEYAHHLEHGLACRDLAETAVLLMPQGSISEGLFHTPAR